MAFKRKENKNSENPNPKSLKLPKVQKFEIFSPTSPFTKGEFITPKLINMHYSRTVYTSTSQFKLGT